MATLVLQTAGAVVGSIVGGPLGAAIGSVVGTVAGSVIDQSLLSSVRGGRATVQGSRLKDLDGISASEGAAIPRLYGRARLGGQIIWATRIEEEVVYSRAKSRGGKGGVGGGLGKGRKQASYRYFANVAIGLCEGEIAFVRRIWVEGKELDLTTVTMRVHTGSQLQTADPLIIAKQGTDDTPAYRGLAYVVFERFPLEAYGNRLPQMTFEVVRPVHGLCQRIRAINLIPGAGETVFEPTSLSVSNGLGSTGLPNRTQLTHTTNWHASLDALQALCPNLEHVALVVSWFGDDLRASHCSMRPRTEPAAVDPVNMPWKVAGLTRATALSVSLSDGQAAFGGTPSDSSVIRAITDLKARGLKVTLYPFIMMDIASANQLANPWNGAASQPAYPWRGRITCHPAYGQPGSVDGTAAAETQISAFLGSATAAQFQISNGSVTYSGAAQSWSLSRMVLHMAKLAEAAGGVDSFILCSELVSLTRVRGAGPVNPAVAGLKAIAAQARLILGSATRITYGADWTEYGAEVRSNGSDVRFPLDPLWSDPNINAVAIDWYPPMTDWRDGSSHLDAAQYDGPHDQRMFEDRVAGGEAYEWYYSSDAARVQQQRLPISDGTYNKPWIYRPKDLLRWWSKPHFERVGSVEKPLPTSWVASSKPIWLLELGCPAVDRGANAPNVFPDLKSSENAIPHFSRAGRDDCVQARCLMAVADHYAEASGRNPVSPAYGSTMVDPERIYFWAYDARPFPAFPDHAEVWADADAYETGHWLNGRLEGSPVDHLIKAILRDFGHAASDTIAADGFVEGYVLDRPMSVRAALSPLADLFAFDPVVREGKLKFSRRLGNPVATIASGECAVSSRQDAPKRIRAQASELPTALTLAFNDPDSDFRQAAVRVAAADATNERDIAIEFAMALRRPVALQRASVLLNEIRGMRETIELSLPPSLIRFEPGDNVLVDGRTYRLKRISDGLFRDVEAVAVMPEHYLGAAIPSRTRRKSAPRLAGIPSVIVLDLPFADSASPVLQYLAASVTPWPGSLTLWRSEDGLTFEAMQQLASPTTIGMTVTALAPGPLWRMDRRNAVDVKIPNAALQSVSETALLQGANLVAIGSPQTGWEIISFAQADLLAAGHWRLSRMIRGLAGSENQAGFNKPAGSSVVLLDGGVHELVTNRDQLNARVYYRVSAEGRDHADPQAFQFEATASSISLLPLSPVHPRARRQASGIILSWIRRTRYGGDNWELAEVPLNEETEAYQVEIMDGATVKRSFTVKESTVLYSSEQEIADFGSPQTALKLRLGQISLAVGPGFSTTMIVPVS